MDASMALALAMSMSDASNADGEGGHNISSGSGSSGGGGGGGGGSSGGGSRSSYGGVGLEGVDAETADLIAAIQATDALEAAETAAALARVAAEDVDEETAAAIAAAQLPTPRDALRSTDDFLSLLRRRHAEAGIDIPPGSNSSDSIDIETAVILAPDASVEVEPGLWKCTIERDLEGGNGRGGTLNARRDNRLLTTNRGHADAFIDGSGGGGERPFGDNVREETATAVIERNTQLQRQNCFDLVVSSLSAILNLKPLKEMNAKAIMKGVIEKVEVYHNEPLAAEYEVKRRALLFQAPTAVVEEYWTCHGCQTQDTSGSVVRTGFKPDDLNQGGTIFGDGIYTATGPRVPNYLGHSRTLILSRALPGRHRYSDDGKRGYHSNGLGTGSAASWNYSRDLRGAAFPEGPEAFDSWTPLGEGKEDWLILRSSEQLLPCIVVTLQVGFRDTCMRLTGLPSTLWSQETGVPATFEKGRLLDNACEACGDTATVRGECVSCGKQRGRRLTENGELLRAEEEGHHQQQGIGNGAEERRRREGGASHGAGSGRLVYAECKGDR